MEVVDYDLYTVPPRWVFLRLETDEGVVGWGEPVVEGRDRTVCQAARELLDDYVVGSDPREVERLWYRMFRGNHYRGGPILMSAIAGIDQALWDIVGKHYDRPVYELLGGPVRDKVRLYTWISGDRPEDLRVAAERALDRGYTALGMMAHDRPARLRTSDLVNRVEERVSTVRDAVGTAADLGVDFRGRVSVPMAKRLLSRLDPYDLMFVEEPVLPEYNEQLSELHARTETPLATGQRIYSRWDFKRIVREGVVDVVQPAISHAGGLTEVTKIGTMAEPFDVFLMPKCSVGPVAFASCLHVQLSVANAVLQERHDDFYAGAVSEFDYIENDDAFDFADGFVRPADRPGLGLEMNEAYIEAQAEKNVAWQSPLWHHEDGTIANW